MAKSDFALNLLHDLLAKARGAGAEAADALMVESTSLAASWRLGKPEDLERSESNDVGLRVLIGHRQAVVSSTDIQESALDELVERAVAMARAVPEDAYCGLAERQMLATEVPDLDLCDPHEPTVERLTELAAAAEDAAMSVEGITNSEGGTASWSRNRVTLANTDGFGGSYPTSQFGISASVVAGSGTQMERDYEYMIARYGSELVSPAEIGRRAGERAVKRLNPRRVKSCQVPVVFDPRVSNGFLRLLAGAIAGPAIARGTSFLKDKMGKRIFAPGTVIVDDPHRPRGLASKPFDGEGVATVHRNIVEDGNLLTWLLDARSARQLNLPTTGHAARSTDSTPSPAPTNLYMEPGEDSPEALIAAIDDGFYITEMMGMSFNAVTGDYSRGAAGFWIEKGEIAYPVSGLTVAGNILQMFPKMTPANDLVFRYGINVPTLRVDGMTVAGS
ncbi:MAG: modulator protein [Rhodospirillaceae bacterium]|nr:modulator protein [Rhodospirillaceae bacterium]